MQAVSLEEVVKQIVAKDPRYDLLAYEFIRNALAFTQKEIASFENVKPRHLSASELLEGIRHYAISTFGSQTRRTLNSWGIGSCQDFGEIVFNMVDFGLIAKNEKDSRADFQNGYDFAEAFPQPFYQNRTFYIFCAVALAILVAALIFGVNR